MTIFAHSIPGWRTSRITKGRPNQNVSTTKMCALSSVSETARKIMQSNKTFQAQAGRKQSEVLSYVGAIL